MRLAFGDCVFDSATHELWRAGEAVRLSPKAFVLLETLLRNRPRALTKQELHDVVWPATFVSDNSLARLVSELRAALGEPGRGAALVRTVHAYGYAFSGEVSETSPREERPASCWLTSGRRVVPLRFGENLIGRVPNAVLFVDSPRVSRRHCRILVEAEGVTIEDLGSKNGTYVEGARIELSSTLTDGDQITVGPTVVTFCRDADGLSTETELHGSRLDG